MKLLTLNRKAPCHGENQSQQPEGKALCSWEREEESLIVYMVTQVTLGHDTKKKKKKHSTNDTSKFPWPHAQSASVHCLCSHTCAQTD